VAADTKNKEEHKEEPAVANSKFRNNCLKIITNTVVVIQTTAMGYIIY